MNRLRQSRTRCAVLWLLLATVLLRTAIPDGFMPERRADASWGLEICHAGLLRHLQANDPSAPAGHSAHGECPFAAALGSALPVSRIAFAALAHASTEAAGRIFSVVLERFASGRPPARGPPLLS